MADDRLRAAWRRHFSLMLHPHASVLQSLIEADDKLNAAVGFLGPLSPEGGKGDIQLFPCLEGGKGGGGKGTFNFFLALTPQTPYFQDHTMNQMCLARQLMLPRPQS